MTADIPRKISKFENRLPPMTPNRHPRNNLAKLAENLAAAERLVSKWDTNSTTDMLFQSNPEEVSMYMDTVRNLHRLMQHLSGSGSTSPELIRLQRLMKMSMARLEKEFHKILLSNSEPILPDRWSSVRASSHLSTEDRIATSTRSSSSSDDDDDGSSHSTSNRPCSDTICDFDMVPLDAVVNLRNIAQCMAKAGYGRECVRVFVLTRNSVVEESLYNLGVEKMWLSNAQKIERPLLDEKIKKWIYAAKISIRILFAREKQMCDEVFEGLDHMRDSCFAEIAKEPTARLLAFPEAIAAGKREPERIFRILDLYETLIDLKPEMKATYCQDSCRSLQEQVDRILVRLGEAARGIFTEFEKAVEKDKSKAPISGGTVHPLTRYVMNYLIFLLDYKETLINLTADPPLELRKALPDEFAVDVPSAPLSIHFGWTVFLLVCKLEAKSDLYTDVAMSYLFLMNNLHYIVEKVKNSELKFVVGEEWLRKQSNTRRKYAASYESAARRNVLSSLTDEAAVQRRNRASLGRH